MMGNRGSAEAPINVDSIYEDYNIRTKIYGTKVRNPTKLKVVFPSGGCCGTICDAGALIELKNVEEPPKVKIPYYGNTREQRLKKQIRQFANGQFTLIMLSDVIPESLECIYTTIHS